MNGIKSVWLQAKSFAQRHPKTIRAIKRTKLAALALGVTYYVVDTRAHVTNLERRNAQLEREVAGLSHMVFAKDDMDTIGYALARGKKEVVKINCDTDDGKTITLTVGEAFDDPAKSNEMTGKIMKRICHVQRPVDWNALNQ